MKSLGSIIKAINRDSSYLIRITKELNENSLWQFKVRYTKMGQAPNDWKNICRQQVINRMSPNDISAASRWVEKELLKNFKNSKFEDY